ncbi:MAG: phosphoribosylanthranilate isomerase [Pseudomonadales bacterium]|nr:phosphoribosylanthranilate isomerase [Pseudomonadales bacterium]
MSRTRVKICGITRPEDALAAVNAGADAIGFVFYGPSPRNLSIEQAARIAQVVPPFVTIVGLFVDPEKALVQSVLENVRIDLLQFHGHESRATCESFLRPYIKAIRVKPEENLDEVFAMHPRATGFLLDTYRPGVPGGTGETFDWSLFPQKSEKPLILAGGLTPDNIVLAINSTQPFAVDVSGGLESGKGIKSHPLINQFIAGVNRVDTER